MKDLEDPSHEGSKGSEPCRKIFKNEDFGFDIFETG